MKLNYRINNEGSKHIYDTDGNEVIIQPSFFSDALSQVHELIDRIGEFPIDIFSILGMRNLSAFIGELLSVSLADASGGLFKSNPHQDGYPDLLLMNEKGQEIWKCLENASQLADKSPFSPFQNGGIEVKATCGAVPTPAKCQKKGFTKPQMGDQRIHLLNGYDWKAHHRDTNHLAGILWDFFDKKPRVVAIFFSNNLTKEDWGKIVQPRPGGGRTTSVSIMSRNGVKKMYENWMVVVEDERYISFLNDYNKSELL